MTAGFTCDRLQAERGRCRRAVAARSLLEAISRAEGFPCQQGIFFRAAGVPRQKALQCHDLPSLQSGSCRPEPHRNREFRTTGTGNFWKADQERNRELTGGENEAAKSMRSGCIRPDFAPLAGATTAPLLSSRARLYQEPRARAAVVIAQDGPGHRSEAPDARVRRHDIVVVTSTLDLIPSLQASARSFSFFL